MFKGRAANMCFYKLNYPIIQNSRRAQFQVC